MKKSLILILILILFTGCSKKEKLTCTYVNDVEDFYYTTTITAEIKDNIVTYAKSVNKYNDSNRANQMCNLYKTAQDAKNNLKCKDKEIIIDNYHASLSKTKLTKDDFLNYMKNQEYTCKTSK